MNAMPVIKPAIVIETLQPTGTDPLSKKKNTVDAKQAIDNSQNEIPTKSSEAKKIVSAFAEPANKIRVIAANANIFCFFIKKLPLYSMTFFI
tara:strand:+ start:45 stop:320 length:276 start_codon:yes stop_codon:yes gene_type:complete